MNWLTRTKWSQGSQEISWEMKHKSGKTLHPAGQWHRAPEKDSSLGHHSAICPWRLKGLPGRDHRSPEAQSSCGASLQNGRRKGALRESVSFTKKEKKQTKWPVTSTFLSLSSEKPQRGKGLKSQKYKYCYNVHVLVLLWHLTKRWQLVYLICNLYLIFLH